jgi:hypothetical protein
MEHLGWYIFLTVANIIVWILIVRTKSYHVQIAKNLADVQYKEQLTKIELTVKTVFEKELATFKLGYDHKLSIASEAKDAVLKYNNALYALLNFSKQNVFLNYDDADFDSMNARFDKAIKNYQRYQSCINLFFDNAEFKQLDKILFSEINGLNQQAFKCFGQCNEISHEARMYTTTTNYQNNPSRDAKHLGILERRLDVIGDFAGVIRKNHSDIEPHLTKMRETLYQLMVESFDKMKSNV